MFLVKNNSKIILGIDPGYDRLGICILEKTSTGENKLIYSHCLESDRKQELHERIFYLCIELKKIILNYNPVELSIEKLFFTTNQKTVMGVSETRGAIIFLCKTLSLKIFEYTPLQIKIALTGYGKATKEQVNFMVKNILQLVTLSKKRDDEYDAIALAITHSASLK